MTYVKVSRLQFYNFMEWSGDAWTGEALSTPQAVADFYVQRGKAKVDNQTRLPL